MITRWPRFNIYLLAFLSLTLLAGCQSADSKRRGILATLRIHTEMNPDPNGKTERIQVFRASPFWLTISKEPFVTEAYVKEAKVIDVMGGYAIQLQFDRQGSWLLEEFTAALKGRHLAIFSQFANPGEDKINLGRWIAAPKIQTHVPDGVMIFTPDASRQEADQIVLGLNNVAKKLETGK